MYHVIHNPPLLYIFITDSKHGKNRLYLQFPDWRHVDDDDGVDDWDRRDDWEQHGAEQGETEALLTALWRVLDLGHDLDEFYEC